MKEISTVLCIVNPTTSELTIILVYLSFYLEEALLSLTIIDQLL